MKIQKVLNSSVVLASDEAEEDCILLGRGIGYGKKAGEDIEKNLVDQIFIPLSNPDARHMLELFSSIPPVYLELTQDVVQYAERQLETQLSDHIYLVMTDHLHFAVERLQQGIIVTNRVFWEIKNFYKREYAIGEYALKLINERLSVTLPREEAANIAFHIVNAQKEPGNNYDAMKAAKIMGEVVDIVNYSVEYSFDKDSIHYSRFISHVQFFVERYLTDRLLDNDCGFLFDQVRPKSPKAIETAEKIRTFFIKTYEVVLPNEEIAYLAVYIARFMQDRRF